jgi:hemoglobin-like flavoprotein
VRAQNKEQEAVVTPEQIMLVQVSWEQIAPMAPKLGDVFYGKLFELAPEARDLFSTDLHIQGETLISMLGVAVNMLDKLSIIDPIVQDLGRRHVRYRVRPEFVQPFRQALMHTLGRALGDGFSEQIRDAWDAMFDALIIKMGIVSTAASS